MQHYETFLIGSLVKRADLENRLSPGLAAFSGLLPFGPMAHGWFGSNRFGQGLREQGRSLLEGIGGAAAGNLAGHGIGGLLQKIPATKLDLQPILQRYPHLARFGPQAESALSKVYLNLPKIRSGTLGTLLALLGGAAGSMHGAARSADNFNQRHPVSNWLHKGAGALGRFVRTGYPAKRQAISAVEKYFGQRSLPALSGIPIEWTTSKGLLGVPYPEVINVLRRAMRKHQPMKPYWMPHNAPYPLP